MVGKYNCLNPDFGDFFDGDLWYKRDWDDRIGFYGIEGKHAFLFNL